MAILECDSMTIGLATKKNVLSQLEMIYVTCEHGDLLIPQDTHWSRRIELTTRTQDEDPKWVIFLVKFRKVEIT
jgi:hypothetical protein